MRTSQTACTARTGQTASSGLTGGIAALLSAALVLAACRSQPAAPTSPPTTPTATAMPAIAGVLDSAPAEIVHAWDFASEQTALGWRPTHDLRNFDFDAGGLLTSPSGGDPYMIGPSVSIDAASAFYVEVRMRSTLGNDAQLFWSVNGGEYNERDSQHFMVNPDGAWHDYAIPVKTNPAWRDRITQLRLDPTNASSGEISIAHIRVLGPMPARIVVTRFSPVEAIATVGQSADVQAVVRNTGDQPAQGASFELRVPPEMSVAHGETSVTVEDLSPGGAITLSWPVSAAAGIFPVTLTQAGQEVAQVNVIVANEPAASAEKMSLENDRLRLTFAKQPFGYGIGALEWRGGDGWRVAGRLRSLGQVIYQDKAGSQHTALLYARDAVRGPDALQFDASFTDVDGATWTSRVTFGLGAGARYITTTYELAASAAVKLLAWSGPEYLAGDGATSFGASRDNALFPGLEYLLADDESSSTRFAHEPLNRRYVPHPNKITIPLMSVAHDGLVTGVMWNALQSWDGAHDRPAALFASPNTWDGQSNHLMRLFVPGMTAGLQENQDRLDQPYDLAAGQPLKLAARLFVDEATDTLAAVRLWLDAFGVPDPPPMPRTYTESLQLALDNYREVVWVPEQKGWRYALQDPWGPGYNAGIALHLWLGSMDEDLRAHAARVWRDTAQQTMTTPPVGGQPNQWFYQPAFLLNQAGGNAGDEAGLLALLARLRLVMDSASSAAIGQRADGSWGYTQTTANTPRFGAEGDTSNGWVASRALQVLYVARLTGDPQLAEAGLKALAFLERQPLRPEGAQTWELALHVPDILASAWVVQCFVEGYRLTGETRYLDQAQRWALAGLPFVYLWNAPDRAVMRYGTVPVFGATNYTFPWFGKPVMWNGLDYAFGLQALAAELNQAGVEPSADWRKVAEGITIATMQMQSVDPAYRGMYPDAWDVVQGGEAYTWWLAPTYLMQNILMLRQQPGALVNTRLFEWNGQQAHLNAVAAIESFDLAGTKLTIKLRYTPNETSAILVSRLVAQPALLALNGETMPESDWAYERGMLVARVPFDAQGEAEVMVWYGE